MVGLGSANPRSGHRGNTGLDFTGLFTGARFRLSRFPKFVQILSRATPELTVFSAESGNRRQNQSSIS